MYSFLIMLSDYIKSRNIHWFMVFFIFIMIRWAIVFFYLAPLPAL